MLDINSILLGPSTIASMIIGEITKITLPNPTRERLAINPGDVVVFRERDGSSDFPLALGIQVTSISYIEVAGRMPEIQLAWTRGQSEATSSQSVERFPQPPLRMQTVGEIAEYMEAQTR